MAYVKSLIALRRALLARRASGSGFERQSVKFFSAWIIIVLMARLVVNAFFVRRAVCDRLTPLTGPLTDSLILGELAVCFLFTLFFLKAGGGPGNPPGRIAFTPCSPGSIILSETAAFFTGPYFLASVVFFVPLVPPLWALNRGAAGIVSVFLLHIASSCLALACRALTVKAGSGRQRGLLPLSLLIAVMYVNPEYSIREDGVFVRATAGTFRLFEGGVPWRTGMPSVCESVPLFGFCVLAVTLMVLAASLRGLPGPARGRTALFRRQRRSAGRMDPLVRDILAVAGFPEGPAGILIALCGGMFLFLHPEGGLLPLFVVSFGALFPVFRVQVSLFGGQGSGAPRFVWASFRIERLFAARLQAAGLCAAVLLAPVVPAAFRTTGGWVWVCSMLFVVSVSTLGGSVASLVWPEGSRLSLLSLLVPGGVCIALLAVFSMVSGNPRRIIVLLSMTALTTLMYALLQRRARNLGAEETDDVLLSAL